MTLVRIIYTDMVNSKNNIFLTKVFCLSISKAMQKHVGYDKRDT